jgi:hypothetical protein
MAEEVSLKALARQILAREREQEKLSEECPKAGEMLGQPPGHRVFVQQDVLAPYGRVASVTDGEPGLEQPCAARRGRVQELNGAFLHFCYRCGRFAAFGYDVQLRAGRLGRWYCGEHRPRDHRSEQRITGL